MIRNYIIRVSFEKNLAKYEYWPQDEFTMLESGGLDNTIQKLVELNREVDSESLILPASQS